ncbi:MAG: hypothetical protein IT430_08140 [Phycisphaerales bacterium]|nr:hypothetical protein [Phycisphaerales bacterium]
MSTLIHQRVAQANAGTNPRVIARVHSGWIVIGDRQVVPGYCLLLPDPVVSDLNALKGAARSAFLSDMIEAGEALLAITGAARINYEILGNLEPALHAHLFPRYADEPAEWRTRPIWFYDWDAARPFDPQQDRAFMEKMASELKRRGLTA